MAEAAALARGWAGAAMHYKRVIPCLDVNAAGSSRASGSSTCATPAIPVELAARYDAAGADELVFLDITATSDKRDTVVDLARRAADEVFIPFTIGGGIRSVADAQAVLDAGADKVSVNSAALQRPELIDELAAHFGAQCVVLAIDAKRRRSRRPAGRPTWPAAARRPDATRSAWAREGAARGAGEILLTSMDRDGTNAGYDLAADRARWPRRSSVPVIASGGAGELDRSHRGAARRRRRGAVRVDLPLRAPHAWREVKAAAGPRRSRRPRPSTD